MTAEESIKTLDMMLNEFRNEDSWSQEYRDAVDIAVKALEKHIEASLSVQSESKWIPCHPSELPTDKVLWVTCDNGWYRYVEKVFWDMTEWSRNVSDVVAYMPYEEPEPYIGEEI